jgi:hypothetical protein
MKLPAPLVAAISSPVWNVLGVILAFVVVLRYVQPGMNMLGRLVK